MGDSIGIVSAADQSDTQREQQKVDQPWSWEPRIGPCLAAPAIIATLLMGILACTGRGWRVGKERLADIHGMSYHIHLVVEHLWDGCPFRDTDGKHKYMHIDAHSHVHSHVSLDLLSLVFQIFSFQTIHPSDSLSFESSVRGQTLHKPLLSSLLLMYHCAKRPPGPT